MSTTALWGTAPVCVVIPGRPFRSLMNEWRFNYEAAPTWPHHHSKSWRGGRTRLKEEGKPRKSDRPREETKTNQQDNTDPPICDRKVTHRIFHTCG